MDEVFIHTGDCFICGTGIRVQLPAGYEWQIRPRSGLSLKKLILMPNSPGTIDSDYRGEVGVGLLNLSKTNFVVKKGDRIAQAVLAPTFHADFIQVDKLTETERGAGGFGHTGVSRGFSCNLSWTNPA